MSVRKPKYKIGDRLDAGNLGTITVEKIQPLGNTFIYKAAEFTFEPVWIEEEDLELIELASKQKSK